MISLVVSQYKTAALKYKRYILPPLIMAAPAMVLVDYVPPLFIAHILTSITSHNNSTIKELWPWVFGFVATAWFGEILWRITIYLINRGDAKNNGLFGQQCFYTTNGAGIFISH